MDQNTQSSPIPQRLESWYRSDAGTQLHKALGQRLQPFLERSFGYHAMQIGPLPGLDLIDGSPINHRIRVSSAGHPACGVLAHSDEIPLESDSVDMLVAFHALDFEARPHAALREMLRVLRPHGHLAVIGFNPFSLLGMGLYFLRMRRDGPWGQYRPVSPQRLVDWMHLVDCRLERMQYLYPIPLVGSGAVRRAIGRFDDWALRRQLPGGGIYLAQAVKERAALRPLRERSMVQQPALQGLALVGNPQAARRRDRAA